MKPSFRLEFAGTGNGHTLRGPGGGIRIENLRHVLPEEEVMAPFLPQDRAGVLLVPFVHTSPLLPGMLAHLNPGAQVVAYNLDLHETQVVAAKLTPFPNVQCSCAADLTMPPGAAGASAFLTFRHGDARDLLFDALERLAMIMPPGSDVLLVMPKARAQDAHREITQCLTLNHTEHVRGQVLLRGRTRADAKPWTPREATFAVTTPEVRIPFSTRPGVFAHGRADAGAIALAESAVVRPTDQLLDIGAGAGTVGLLLAARMQQHAPQPAGRVVLVDSNARAVACAERNIALNRVGFVSAVLADRYVAEPPASFDVVVANPPYFNDHGICRFFIEIAARALKPGGRLFLVSKHAEVVAQYLQEMGLTLLEHKRRRGYDISVACR